MISDFINILKKIGQAASIAQQVAAAATDADHFADMFQPIIDDPRNSSERRQELEALGDAVVLRILFSDPEVRNSVQMGGKFASKIKSYFTGSTVTEERWNHAFTGAQAEKEAAFNRQADAMLKEYENAKSGPLLEGQSSRTASVLYDQNPLVKKDEIKLAKGYDHLRHYLKNPAEHMPDELQGYAGQVKIKYATLYSNAKSTEMRSEFHDALEVYLTHKKSKGVNAEQFEFAGNYGTIIPSDMSKKWQAYNEIRLSVDSVTTVMKDAMTTMDIQSPTRVKEDIEKLNSDVKHLKILNDALADIFVAKKPVPTSYNKPFHEYYVEHDALLVMAAYAFRQSKDANVPEQNRPVIEPGMNIYRLASLVDLTRTNRTEQQITEANIEQMVREKYITLEQAGTLKKEVNGQPLYLRMKNDMTKENCDELIKRSREDAVNIEKYDEQRALFERPEMKAYLDTEENYILQKIAAAVFKLDRGLRRSSHSDSSKPYHSDEKENLQREIKALSEQWLKLKEARAHFSGENIEAAMKMSKGKYIAIEFSKKAKEFGFADENVVNSVAEHMTVIYNMPDDSLRAALKVRAAPKRTVQKQIVDIPVTAKPEDLTLEIMESRVNKLHDDVNGLSKSESKHRANGIIELLIGKHKIVDRASEKVSEALGQKAGNKRDHKSTVPVVFSKMQGTLASVTRGVGIGAPKKTDEDKQKVIGSLLSAGEILLKLYNADYLKEHERESQIKAHHDRISQLENSRAIGTNKINILVGRIHDDHPNKDDHERIVKNFTTAIDNPSILKDYETKIADISKLLAKAIPIDALKKKIAEQSLSLIKRSKNGESTTAITMLAEGIERDKKALEKMMTEGETIPSAETLTTRHENLVTEYNEVTAYVNEFSQIKAIVIQCEQDIEKETAELKKTETKKTDKELITELDGHLTRHNTLSSSNHQINQAEVNKALVDMGFNHEVTMKAVLKENQPKPGNDNSSSSSSSYSSSP